MTLVHGTTLPGRPIPDQEEPPLSGTTSSTKALPRLLTPDCLHPEPTSASLEALTSSLCVQSLGQVTSIWCYGFQSCATPVQTFPIRYQNVLVCADIPHLHSQTCFSLLSRHLAQISAHLQSPVFQLGEVGCIENREKKSLLSEMLIDNRLTKVETRNSGLVLSSLGLLFLQQKGTKTNKNPKPNVYAELLAVIIFFFPHTHRDLFNDFYCFTFHQF